jgi:16S rRNA (guanine527-N7)-methyltransferase
MTEPASERFTGNTQSLKALAPYDLGAPQLDKLREILRLLESDQRAPTAVRDAAQATERHLADSLAALQIDCLKKDGRDVADLGTGAGFPGVVLAVALPRSRVSLVESQRRKCEFLGRLLQAAGIENASVVCARAEEWAEGLSAHDVVVARALARQPVVLEYAAPLLRVGGALVDWRGRRDREDEQAAQAAARTLGLELQEVREVHPFPEATDRHLHVWRKHSETPERFPRRVGIARKRPLGR